VKDAAGVTKEEPAAGLTRGLKLARA